MPQQNHHYDTSLTDEYTAAVHRLSDVVHDFRKYAASDDENTTKNSSIEPEATILVEEFLRPEYGISCDNNEQQEGEPIAFVISNVLTPAECDELIAEAEDFGIEDRPYYTARTAKRTKDYTNKALSKKVEARIQGILDAKFRDTKATSTNQKEKENSNESNLHQSKRGYSKNPYMGPFYGIHTNWRILRYDAGDGSAFPAHFDQMDSLRLPKTDGSGRKDFVVSSHTLLVQLSDNSLEGGATRFYPRAKANKPRTKDKDQSTFRREQFDYSVDVLLPKGWALAFRQRGLLHAGQPIVASSPVSKYVAQAGILRVLPEGTLLRPSVFKNGPGVTEGAF